MKHVRQKCRVKFNIEEADQEPRPDFIYVVAKKPLASAPLVEVAFYKYLINRPAQQRKRQSYNPCKNVPGPSLKNTEKPQETLPTSRPNPLFLKYGNMAPARPVKRPRPTLPFGNEQDLWSPEALEVVQQHMEALLKMTDEEQDVVMHTMGQADNPQWHDDRLGRITASQFFEVTKCRKPDYLVKRIMYPSKDAYSEAVHYGRTKELVAVAAYVDLMHYRDNSVQVNETGLHVHPLYNFLGASSDRIVLKNGEEGLLEEKCPITRSA